MPNKNLGIAWFLIIVLLGKLTGFFKDLSIAYYLGIDQIVDSYFVSVYVAGLFYAGVSAAVPLLILPEANKDNQTDRENGLLKSIFSIMFVTVMISIILFYFSYHVSEFFLKESSVYSINSASHFIKIASLTFPLSAITLMATSIRLANGEKIPANSLALINNSIFIISIAIWNRPDELIYALYMTIVGWIMMVLMYGKPLHFVFNNLKKFSKHFSFYECKKVFSISKIFYIDQIIPAISLYFAAQLGQGSASLFSYSNKLFMLYITLSLVIINTYIIPFFSKSLRNITSINSDIDKCIKITGLLIFPVVIFSVINAEFLVKIIFERGAFSADNSKIVTEIFRVLALAVPAMLAKDVLVKILLLKNPKAGLVRYFSIGIIINISICFLAINYHSISGIALGFTLSTILILLLITYSENYKSTISNGLKIYFIGYITLFLLTILFYQFENSIHNKTVFILPSLFLLITYYSIMMKKNYFSS